MSTIGTRTGCSIRVRMQIEFSNQCGASAADFDARVTSWQEGIDQIWNNTWDGRSGITRWRCCPVVFEIDAQVGSGSSGYHQVTVHPDGDLPGGAWGAPHASTDIGLLNLTADWEFGEDQIVAAHEAGHMMALEDEYTIISGYAVNDHPLPEGGPYDPAVSQCIMATTSLTNITRLPEHLTWLMEALDLTCSFRCCVLRPPDLLMELIRMWRRPPPTRPREPEMPSGPPPDWNEMFALADRATPRHLAYLGNLMSTREDPDERMLEHQIQSRVLVQRWLAAIGMAHTRGGRARQLLVGALDDADVSVRVAAARSLLLQGDQGGIPVLIDTLESDEVLLRHPPGLARGYANRLLRRFTGEDYGFAPHAPDAKRRAAVAAWRRWWNGR